MAFKVGGGPNRSWFRTVVRSGFRSCKKALLILRCWVLGLLRVLVFSMGLDAQTYPRGVNCTWVVAPASPPGPTWFAAVNVSMVGLSCSGGDRVSVSSSDGRLLWSACSAGVFDEVRAEWSSC
jgi:hypothetical protein